MLLHAYTPPLKPISLSEIAFWFSQASHYLYIFIIDHHSIFLDSKPTLKAVWDQKKKQGLQKKIVYV